uniref:Uncharacterized protein n=1 Tax=Romanomermis culicivorax TaxID=13658 RepID=A0A915I4A5_ROMCU
MYGSYFCSLLGEHAQRVCSDMFSEHSVEQAARKHARRANVCPSSRNPSTKDLLAVHSRVVLLAKQYLEIAGLIK